MIGKFHQESGLFPTGCAPQWPDSTTVIGYHGTGLTAALRIVTRLEAFRRSERDYDWLGRGIYFWEYAPKQALNFARIRQRQFQKKRSKTAEDTRRATESLAVVACMIRLGFCLDLTEPENVKYLKDVFDEYKKKMELAAAELPKNTRRYRKLDCAIFEYAYQLIEESEPNSRIDTVRGIFVSTDTAKRVWPGSWISKDTHIQLNVRNPTNLLGTWLHYPSELEVSGACEALQGAAVGFEPKDPKGSDQAAAHDGPREN